MINNALQNKILFRSLIKLKAHLTIVISRFQVIPNLVESLIQNERARIIIIESFASIRDLAIIIQRAGEILKQTRGINALSRIFKYQL